MYAINILTVVCFDHFYVGLLLYYTSIVITLPFYRLCNLIKLDLNRHSFELACQELALIWRRQLNCTLFSVLLVESFD